MLAYSFDITLGLPLDSTFTLRSTRRERTAWDVKAELLGLSTGKYIRMALASEDIQQKLSVLIAHQNARKEYALLLQALGKSRIANNLNQLAHSANIGDLNLDDPSVIAQINEAYEAILYIRSLLIQQSGVRAL